MPQKEAEAEDINIWIPAEKQWRVASLEIWRGCYVLCPGGQHTYFWTWLWRILGRKVSAFITQLRNELKTLRGQIILDVLIEQPSTSSLTCRLFISNIKRWLMHRGIVWDVLLWGCDESASDCYCCVKIFWCQAPADTFELMHIIIAH